MQIEKLFRYKEDTNFKLPKAIINIELRNQLANKDPTHLNMLNIFADLFEDFLNEYSYHASLARLVFEIGASKYGIDICFSGFNDKLSVLMENIFEKLVNFKIDSKRFEIIKEIYKRSLIDFESEEPRSQSDFYMNLILCEKKWTIDEQINAIDDFTIEDLQKFIKEFLNENLFVEFISYGNISHEKAIEYSNLILDKLGLNADTSVHTDTSNLRQFQLPKNSEHVYLKTNKTHQTKAIRTYFQCSQNTTRDNVLIELFDQCISESCFDVLRTKEQLGYIVCSSIREFAGVRGIEISIQSDKSPTHLNHRIENFLELTKKTLKKMTKTEFETHVEALVLTKLEEIKTMSDQFEIYHGEISTREYHFDRERIEVEYLKKNIKKSDLVHFFEEFISIDAKNRKKLSIYIYPPELDEEVRKATKEAIIIDDMNQWKSSLGLYDAPKPFIKLC